MNTFRKILESISEVIFFPVSVRQVSSVLVLLVVMMPVTVPVPVWAYDLKLPGAPLSSEAVPVDNTARNGSFRELFGLVEDWSTITDETPIAAGLPSIEEKSVDDPSDEGAEPIGETGIEEKRDIEAEKKGVGAAATNSVETVSSARPSRIIVVNQLPPGEHESIYSPQNNLGTPAGQTEADSSNRAAALPIKHRVGSANFSFGIPFASLAGRGIDAGFGTAYNSRTWNKSCSQYDTQGNCTQNHFTYDVDQSWIAPGFTAGFGHLETSVTPLYSGSTIYAYKTFPLGLRDANGTRRRLVCTNYSGSACLGFRTDDGSFIKVSGQVVSAGPSGANFTATGPDGSKTYYAGGFGSGNNNRKHYPVAIQDNNGNRIRISYKDNLSGRIDKITDTINRQIKFYYENDASGNPDKLVTVTIPGMGTTEEIQTIRLFYETMTLDTAGKFGNQTTAQITAPAAVRVLRWVYMPASKTGYKYTYHSNYGMIKKIERRVGVVADSTSTSATGTISDEGIWAATTEYDFPAGTAALDDVPRYTKRTDDWLGRTATSAQETLYDSPDPVPGSDHESEITVVDNGFNVETKNLVGADGMLKETTVTKLYGPGLQYSKLLSKSKYTWTDRNLTRLEVTNDALLVKATEFVYDGYNNQVKARECGYAAAGTACTDATALRITETGYETGAGWIAANLLGLVKSVQTKTGGSVVSKTLFEYDHGGDGTADDATITPRNDLGDTGTHSTFYNPAEPARTETICPLEPNGQDQHRDQYGCVTIYHPGYSAASAYRGNVTKVGRMLEVNATAITATNADVTDYNFDIAGNLVSATLSCCQLKTIEYGLNFAETGYAFPTKEIKGTSPQLISEATYNRNTGLVLTSKDENDQITQYQYETDTLRPKKTIFANGGYVESFYSDKEQAGSNLLPGYVTQKTTLEAGKFAESISYFDARGLGIRSASLTPDGWSIAAVEHDKLGRAVKSYNPFYGATPNAGVPLGTKFVEATGIDAFGRSTQVKLQDDTTASTYFSTIGDIPSGFNKTFVTMTDQAGKQRRQVIDSLGRLVRVDEPDSTGALPDLENPAAGQKTDYLYDGNDNLIKVIQSDGANVQERKFKYDPLSRLVAERQVEGTPTLTDAGVHGTPDPNKWTKVLKYNQGGLLEQGIDARGVTTTFDYDGLNRVEEVIYSDGTPRVKYYYGQTRTGFFNKGALTKVETIRETSTPAEIFATSAEFDYDLMGRLVKHRQWINGQQYDLEYGYNLSGQLTSQKYPSGKIVTTGYDANGRLSGIADAQRTYVSGMQYQGKGNSLSRMTLGNGTTETFTLNDRFQMTGQELTKGSDVLQKYVYGYGQVDANGVLQTTQNNGQLGTIESYIGSNKQATQKFRYDHIGRLKESAEYRGDNSNLTYKQVFDFDRFGNLYRKSASNPITGQQNPLSFTAIEDADISKSTNRFTSNTTYDDAGQVVNDAKFRQMSFGYDANGRQIKASRTGAAPDAWTVYDASGNRVATKVNNIWQYMVYNASGRLVAEYGQLADGVGGVKYVQQDWQGSVRTTTNNNGFVTARTDHQAFGGEVGYGTGQRSIDQGYNRDATTRQSYGLTERDDATGQDHTWFRKNESAAGRWTSPDPYNGSISLADPQSFNRYSYVQNDPTNFVDPSGLQAVAFVCWDVTTFYTTPGGTKNHTRTTTECRFFGGGGGGSVFSSAGNSLDLGNWGSGDGGTPSSVGQDDWRKCVDAVRERFGPAKATEAQMQAYQKELGRARDDRSAALKYDGRQRSNSYFWTAIGAIAVGAVGSAAAPIAGTIAGAAIGGVIGYSASTDSSAITREQINEAYATAIRRIRQDNPEAVAEEDRRTKTKPQERQECDQLLRPFWPRNRSPSIVPSTVFVRS